MLLTFHTIAMEKSSLSQPGKNRMYILNSSRGRAVKKCLQIVMSIEFLPTAVVGRTFRKRVVQLSALALNTFLNYVNNSHQSNSHFVTFRTPMWNVFDRTVDTRTNNNVIMDYILSVSIIIC